MDNKSEWVVLGSVDVESGMLLIGDPFDLVDKPTVTDEDWQAAVDVGAGENDIGGAIGSLFAEFVVTNLPSDGTYAVEGYFDTRGDVVEIRIRF